MHTKLASFLSKLCPKRFLPKGRKQVNGETFELDVEERREHLARNLAHIIDKNLNKFSPFRIVKAVFRRRRLYRKKLKFNQLVAQVVLSHAGIEQELKSTLIIDWGVPNEFQENYTDYHGKEKTRKVVIDKHFGEKLKKRFFKELKIRQIPDKMKAEYQSLYEEFWKLSEERNSVLKASYSFNEETAEISQVHDKYFPAFGTTTGFEETLALWMPKVDLEEIKKLFEEFANLNLKFRKLRAQIFLEKQKLSIQIVEDDREACYPDWIFKNPYLYLAMFSVSKK